MKTNHTQPTSRHKKNFETYITDYAQANDLEMSGAIWKAALEAARRLDYTADRSRRPNMKLLVSGSPSGLLARVLRLFRAASEAHLTELDDIRAFLQLAPLAAAQQSQIEWGPLRNGLGSWMKAHLLPGGQQKGSPPTPREFLGPSLKLLYRRKRLDGRTLYNRGHLLHDLLGGPGVDFNWVPLTAAPGGDFGANHANAAHRNLVEGPILWAFLNMHTLEPTISEIKYEVFADENRLPRPGTEELRKIAKAYEEMADDLKAKLASPDESFVDEPTHQLMIKELAKNPPSPHLNNAFIAVEAEMWEPWTEVHRRIKENQKLWQFEDQNVPRALLIEYSWVENGVTVEARQRIVVIDLPHSLAAKFEE